MPTMQDYWGTTPDEIESIRECMARYAAYRTHEFDDETGYCTACGQQDTYAIANAIQCFGAPNITAISHLRRPMLETEDFHGNIPA